MERGAALRSVAERGGILGGGSAAQEQVCTCCARCVLCSNALSVSRTYLEMPVVIHELSTRAVPAGALEGGPRLVNQRARLYAQLLPPDQLNPQG